MGGEGRGKGREGGKMVTTCLGGLPEHSMQVTTVLPLMQEVCDGSRIAEERRVVGYVLRSVAIMGFSVLSNRLKKHTLKF